MADYIHYIPRRIVSRICTDLEDPWFAQHKPDVERFADPRFHISRSRNGPATQICPGDRIWLASQLSGNQESFPPSIDALICVDSVEQGASEDGAPFRRYRAGPGSRWFPLADSTKVFAKLQTVNARGQKQNLLSRPDQPIGQAIQSIRRLANPSVLERQSEKVAGRPLHLVSYRLVDGTCAATGLASRLVAEGKSVFWDRWSLPRGLAERRELLEDADLDAYIFGQIRAAKVVWGVKSPTYGDPGTYTAKEIAEAKRVGNYREAPA